MAESIVIPNPRAIAMRAIKCFLAATTKARAIRELVKAQVHAASIGLTPDGLGLSRKAAEDKLASFGE